MNTSNFCAYTSTLSLLLVQIPRATDGAHCEWVYEYVSRTVVGPVEGISGPNAKQIWETYKRAVFNWQSRPENVRI